MPDTIFLSLASYRDPELVPSINSAIANAHDPDNLRFGVGWQHSPEETLPPEWHTDPRFIILDVPTTDTKGVCWMRAMIMQQWAGEDFYLQLDSHHRFAPNWDIQLLKMWSDLKACGVEKPLLTSYISAFNPANDPAGRHPSPYSFHWDRFIPEGSFFTRPGDMPNWQQLRFPESSRFFSAHFAFVEGKFCREVPYDPNIFFHGEEPDMAVRAYTHGYDSFAIHRPLVWHEYTRVGRPHVWDQKEPIEKIHHTWNVTAHARVKKLLGTDGERCDIDFGPYGLGTKRTLADYERFAGIRFRDRTVQQWTLDFKPPPNPNIHTDQEWEESLLRYVHHCIDVHMPGETREEFVKALDEFDFWAVTFHNKAGKEVYRQDAVEKDIQGFKPDPDRYCKVWRSFFADPKDPPVTWIVRMHSKTRKEDDGWCPIITGPCP